VFYVSNVSIFCNILIDNFKRIIIAAVVYHNQFKIGKSLRENAIYAAQKVRSAIVRAKDDRNAGFRVKKKVGHNRSALMVMVFMGISIENNGIYKKVLLIFLSFNCLK